LIKEIVFKSQGTAIDIHKIKFDEAAVIEAILRRNDLDEIHANRKEMEKQLIHQTKTIAKLEETLKSNDMTIQSKERELNLIKYELSEVKKDFDHLKKNELKSKTTESKLSGSNISVSISFKSNIDQYGCSKRKVFSC
jgi:septal ring factor EnvC (AmiA/AmiB activator)